MKEREKQRFSPHNSDRSGMKEGFQRGKRIEVVKHLTAEQGLKLHG